MRIRVLLLTVSLILALITSGMAAPAAKPVLQQAAIEVVTSDGNSYKVNQAITVANAGSIAKGMVQNVLAILPGAKVSDLTISVNGKKVDAKLTAGDYLTKVAFPLPAGTTDKLTYNVAYSVKQETGKFSVPLLVPLYASTGKEEVVKVDFTAPAGNYIHENSFPIITRLPTDNKLSTTMANIPSQLRYSFGKQPSSIFNLYNVISTSVFLFLMLVLVKWFMLEQQKGKARMQKQGGGF